MNELTVTVTGWVATDPKLHVVPGGTDLVSFRLASTSRYYDRTSNSWVDRETQWFTVRVFRAAALLVARSVKKGQPVVVAGRLQCHEWEGQGGPRIDLQIDAQAVGHDLTRGVADFTRAVVDEAAKDEAAEDEPLTEGEVDDASVEVDDEALELADA
ncbi:single-stranded DNA-binding protein [Demequina sp.]|uniref:single-stranded DNA-binding protein n=1 Tax=Demequina sp. TaxID=2050685 RepID=UPI003D0CBB85